MFVGKADGEMPCVKSLEADYYQSLDFQDDSERDRAEDRYNEISRENAIKTLASNFDLFWEGLGPDGTKNDNDIAESLTKLIQKAEDSGGWDKQLVYAAIGRILSEQAIGYATVCNHDKDWEEACNEYR